MTKNPKNRAAERPETSAGRYSYTRLFRIIHEKARLGIMASLLAHKGGLTFNELKELCDLSDGNLSRHVQVLERAGLVEAKKGYVGNRPRTDYKITTQGRKRFMDYIQELEHVVQDAHETGSERSQPGVRGLKQKPA
jgi:DNA-binding HxlR family transcriptional regulator